MKQQTSTAGLVITFFLLAADQATKHLAKAFLAGNSGFYVLPGIFQLYYLENRGAAFGALSGRQWLFVAIAVIMSAIAVYVYCRAPRMKHYLLMRIVCILIAAGALGNMIDRIFLGYVIDFLYISLIDFPVFNVADCYVCVGAALAVVAMFTVYREEDFRFLRPGR